MVRGISRFRRNGCDQSGEETILLAASPKLQQLINRVEGFQRELSDAMPTLAQDIHSLAGLQNAYENEWTTLENQVLGQMHAAFNTLGQAILDAAKLGLDNLKEILKHTVQSEAGHVKETAQALLDRVQALGNAGQLTPATLARAVQDALKKLKTSLKGDTTRLVAKLAEEWNRIKTTGAKTLQEFLKENKPKFLEIWKGTVDFVLKDLAELGHFFPAPLGDLWTEAIVLFGGALGSNRLSINLAKLREIPVALGTKIIAAAAPIFANPLDQLFGNLSGFISDVLPGVPGELLTSVVSSSLTQLLQPLVGNPLVGLGLLLLRGLHLFGMSAEEKNAVANMEIPLPPAMPSPNSRDWRNNVELDPFRFEIAKVLVGVKVTLTMTEFENGVRTGTEDATAVMAGFNFLARDDAHLSQGMKNVKTMRDKLESEADAILKAYEVENDPPVASLVCKYVATIARGPQVKWEHINLLEAAIQ